MNNYLNLIKNNKNFRLIAVAKFLSDLGSQMQRFGLPWLVYEHTNSGSLMALNFTMTLLPGLLFGIIGGDTADKFSKKKILILGDFFSGFITIFLYYMHVLDPKISVVLIFILTFLLSSISSFYTPAFTAIIPNIVSNNIIISANSVFSIFESIVSLIGPVVATLIIGIVGAWITLLINAVSFILSGIIIINIKYKSHIKFKKLPETRKKFNFKKVTYIFEEFSWLKFYLYIMSVMYIALGCVGSILQFYFINKLHLKGVSLGATFVLFEFIPVLIASLLVNMLIKNLSYKYSIFISASMFSLSIFGLGLTTNYFIVVLFGIIQNFFGTIALVCWESIRQERIISSKLGMVSGIVVTIQSFLMPLGGIVSSLLLSKIDVQQILKTSGILCFLITLLIYLVFHKTPYIESD